MRQQTQNSEPFRPSTMIPRTATRLIRTAARQQRPFSSMRVAAAGRSWTKTTSSAPVFTPSLQQMRSLFIQTEVTPNPESLKFLPGKPVLEVDEGGESGSGFYATRADKDEIARSPLAKMLFEIEGVKSVYLGADFVTVTKFAESHWVHLRTNVFSKIMDFYASGKSALSEVAEVTDTTIFDDDDEVVAMIKELLESRIRPAVQEDGGDIRYVDFDAESGIVKVRLAGSCVGCPSSSVTLKNGVENMLLHYIPEVTGIEAEEDEEEASSGGDGGQEESPPKAKTYEERLAAAGIPFSD